MPPSDGNKKNVTRLHDDVDHRFRRELAVLRSVNDFRIDSAVVFVPYIEIKQLERRDQLEVLRPYTWMKRIECSS